MSDVLHLERVRMPTANPDAEPLQLLPEAQDGDQAIDLNSVAYEKYHRQAFHEWSSLEREKRRDALRDRYIFLSVAICVGPHVANLLEIDRDEAEAFVGEITGAIASIAAEKRARTIEWFNGLDQVASAFTEQNYLPAARTIVAIGFSTGVVNFPSVAQSLHVHAAYLDALVGRREKAAKTALRLMNRPYLLASRHELPKVYLKLMYVLSASNHLREYKEILWRGASNRSAGGDIRGIFVEQIARTYRGVFRAMMHGEIRLIYRLPLIIGYIERLLQAPWVGWTKAYVIARRLHRDCLYILNRYSHRMPVYRQPREARRLLASLLTRLKRPRKRILITRGMGGIGDILMMTPGIRALAMRYPKAQIDFAIPKSFHPLFEGFTAARVLDINEDEIDMYQYTKWINLTDCPAPRIEMGQYPNVRRNRIEIFARALGISRWRLKWTAGCLPSYKVSPEEQKWARGYLAEINSNGLPVVGVQPFAADTYRNWPYMEELVRKLSETHLVLIFHNERIPDYDFTNTVQVLKPLRQCVALAAECERLVVLDSSFLHLSAAIAVPTVAIFGAISGKVRTKDYPNIHLITPEKREYPCYPCWRNEQQTCALSNARESICFRSLQIGQVLAAVNGNQAEWRVRQNVVSGLNTWIWYGSQ